MTQQDYNLICEILSNGAPALSQRLIKALSVMINDYQSCRQELEELKTKETKDEKKSVKKSEDK